MSNIRVLPRRSFNKHDASVSSVEGRIEVVIDMKRRLGLVVGALGRKSSFASVPEMTDYLNNRLGSKYSNKDIRTAVKVLQSVGVVARSGHTVSLTKMGLAKFRTVKYIKAN